MGRSRAAEFARGPPRVDALPKPTAAGREFRRGRAEAAQSFPRRQGQPLDRPRRASPHRRSSDVHLQRASKNSGTEKGLLRPAAFSRTTSRDAALMRVRQTGLGAGSERQSALESTPYKPRTASRRQGSATMLSKAGCRPKQQGEPFKVSVPPAPSRRGQPSAISSPCCRVERSPMAAFGPQPGPMPQPSVGPAPQPYRRTQYFLDERFVAPLLRWPGCASVSTTTRRRRTGRTRSSRCRAPPARKS